MMNKKQKKVLYRILLSLVFMIGIMILTSYVSVNLYVEVILYLIPLIFVFVYKDELLISHFIIFIFIH